MKSNDEILQEIEGRRNQGAGIENFRSYLSTIGNPHKALTCIHIAGTNGKGSTLNYIRAMLQCAGYRIATFSSPYLETHYDRIRINDECIEEAVFRKYYEQYHEGWYAYGLGSFEIDTAIAFSYFHDQNVDLCIIETGIGGRYDCTNVITPLVSVITNIGKDHMDRLGDTVEKIAWQKGGIIKPQVPLVTSERKQECLDVFQTLCDEHQSKLIKTIETTPSFHSPTCIEFLYRELAITLTQGALYQIDNCACAIEAIEQIKDRFPISEESIIEGCKQAQWKGRFETVCISPQVIIDGAHNEEGIQALVNSLQDFEHVRILFSALKDKDTHQMMRILCEASDDVCVTEFPFYRVKPAKELAEDFPVRIDQDYRHAIIEACKNKDIPLIITGSLYFISEVRAFFSTLHI